MRGFGLQRQRPVADQLRIAAVLLRKTGRWVSQYARDRAEGAGNPGNRVKGK